MLASLWNLGAFIVALSILVAIHEFGHFWAARRCAVKVHRFSIGFGKTLFKWVDKQGTEFIIATIPLGGYVKMLDGRVETVPVELQQYAFDKKTVWQRIAIVAAGPIANFLLAIIAFFFMYMIGINSAKPVIQETVENTPMAVIKSDHSFQITAINETDVAEWEALNLALIAQIGENEFDVTIQPLSGAKNQHSFEPSKTFTVSLADWKFEPKKESIITSLGLVPYRPKVHLQVAAIVKGGAGFRAGLQENDKLLAINGVKLNDWNEFVELIQQNAEQALQVKIERGTIAQVIRLIPDSRNNQAGEKQGYVGVSPVVEGSLSIKNLSGPVAIAKGAGMSANYGIEYFLGFLALISVNLGLMNLIPLPVLDGGHLLYYFAELLTGKPVPEKIQEIGFKIGGTILMSLMLFALLNDLNLFG